MKAWLVLALLVSGPALAEDKVIEKTIDPTENVKSLQASGDRRQDDLRAIEAVLNELRYSNMKELISLRAEYEDKLRNAEAKRIDAIRLVDSNSISVANERAVATATALAKTVQDSAQLVSTTAAESNRNLQQKFEDITKRISALEQAGAEGIGKQKFADPAQTALIEEVRKLSRAQSDSAGVGTGRGDVIGWIVAGIGLLIAFASMVFLAIRSKNEGRRTVSR